MMKRYSATDDYLSMLNPQSPCIVTSIAVRPKDGFKSIQGSLICHVPNGMNIDLETSIEPLSRLSRALEDSTQTYLVYHTYKFCFIDQHRPTRFWFVAVRFE